MLPLEKSKLIKKISPLVFLPIGLIISIVIHLYIAQHMDLSYIDPRAFVVALRNSSIVLVISSFVTLLTIKFIRNFPKSFLLSFSFSILAFLIFHIFQYRWFYRVVWDFLSVIISIAIDLFPAFPIIILTSLGITLPMRQIK